MEEVLSVCRLQVTEGCSLEEVLAVSRLQEAGVAAGCGRSRLQLLVLVEVAIAAGRGNATSPASTWLKKYASIN